VLDITAKSTDGQELFKERRVYMPQCTDSLGPVMVLGPDKKLGIIRDTTFQPLQVKQEQFQINLAKKLDELEVEAAFSYVLRPGDEITIAIIRQKVATRDLFLD
jgi:hypothetical protein